MLQAKVDKLITKSQKRRCASLRKATCSLKRSCSSALQISVWSERRGTEEGSQYKSAPKRPSLLGHLAEAATTIKSVVAVSEQSTQQAHLQQCSNDAGILKPSDATQQGIAVSAVEVAACPICGIKLPIQALTLHVEQELLTLEEDISNSAVSEHKKNTSTQRHVVCGGVVPSKQHIPSGSMLSQKYKASQPAAVHKSQKASLALSYAAAHVQLPDNMNCRFWCLVGTTPRRSPTMINPGSPDPLCLSLITILAVLEAGYASFIATYTPICIMGYVLTDWKHHHSSAVSVATSVTLQQALHMHNAGLRHAWFGS